MLKKHAKVLLASTVIAAVMASPLVATAQAAAGKNSQHTSAVTAKKVDDKAVKAAAKK